jgi:hypothetical protein
MRRELTNHVLLQQEAASGAQQQQHTGGSGLGELSQSDLTGLVSSLDEDTEEDLFKQLGESTFELDNFFTDFEDKASATHIRTVGIHFSHDIECLRSEYTLC